MGLGDTIIHRRRYKRMILIERKLESDIDDYKVITVNNIIIPQFRIFANIFHIIVVLMFNRYVMRYNSLCLDFIKHFINDRSEV